MRKILLVIVLAVATQIVSAQITNGTWLLGGHTSFSSSKQESFKRTSFSFDPNIGYFFMDKLAGGVRGSISTEKDKPSDDKSTDVLIGPFVRYYFLPTGQKTNIFLDGNFMFGSEKFTPGTGTATKDNETMFGFMAGPAFFLSDNVALEVALSYNSLKFKSDPDRINTFGVEVGFQIHLNCGSKKSTGGSKSTGSKKK